MNATRVRDLAVIGIVALVASWLLAEAFYGSLPPIRLLVGASLYPVAVAEVAFGFVIRNRVASHRVGMARSQLHPITVARAVALAKASALVGAASAGVWAGLLLVIAPDRAIVRAAMEDLPGATIGFLGALALTAAALWLEQCCRTPDDEEDEGRPGGDPSWGTDFR
ncbi:DUF3180 domain-containing protein [Hoyosella altamirensis]|uniref:DUF3180 domain-containing protein n=1 Tax=Hoyosella altamirensis TaxID=616997 RepID=A0A839RP62_9ACTN|nr:DUF3180 domain-containing protein [Hoyosella altamirensis]MBB3037783.1 hypothetical protein [Hoyosella altamirensis]